MHIPGSPRDAMSGARFKGGGGSSPSTTTTVQKSDPWEGQQPYLSNVMANAKWAFRNDVDNGNLPNLSLAPAYYSGKTVADLSPETQKALQLQTKRALNGSPVMDAAQGQLTNTLSGDYLSAGNPYFQGMMDNVGASVRPQLDSQFEGAGRYGSGAHQKAMADALAQAGTQAAYQNYSAERGNQIKGMLFAPEMAKADYQDIAALSEVGGAKEAYQQDLLNAAQARYNWNANRYATSLQNYANLVSGNYGGTTQGTMTAPGVQRNRLGGALGGAASGAAAGTAIMPGWGTAIGAMAGGLMGAFS